MYTPWDVNDEQERLDAKYTEYFGDFANNIRFKMMSKNFQKITNIYDIYYPKIRYDMLSKNEVIVAESLENDSVLLRENLLSKKKEVVTDLDTISENYRKSLQSRNKIMTDSDKLLSESEDIRNGLLIKNINTFIDLEKYSKDIRNNILSKNNEIDSDLQRSSSDIRDGLISKNNYGTTDLSKLSEEFRNNDLSKNIVKKDDVYEESNFYRENLLFKNKPSNIQPEVELIVSSKEYLDNNIYKNSQLKEIDLLSDSKYLLENNISKNEIKQSDLYIDGHTLRENNISKNDIKTTDLEQFSKEIRDNILKNNGSKSGESSLNGDLYRGENLSKNKKAEIDLLEKSKDTINLNISKQSEEKHIDLDKVGKIYRDENLSNNSITPSDLLKNSEELLSSNISKNNSHIIDLAKQSELIRVDNISKNGINNEIDLNSYSDPLRKKLINLNEPEITSLEELSTEFRSKLLSNNSLKNIDLETNSAKLRDNLLNKNKQENTDLLSDSDIYRNSLVSKNKPVNSDLLESGKLTLDGLLSKNSETFTDLEQLDKPLREGLLSKNVPIETNLENRSIQDRENLLSKNITVETDLNKISSGYRDNLTSKNNEVTSDLYNESKSIRDGLISYNIVKEGDLLKDSKESRELLISKLDVNYSQDNLLKNTNKFRENLLDKNVPSDLKGIMDMEETFIVNNVSRNVHKDFNLLQFSEPIRQRSLSKNSQGSYFGVNIAGVGTSSYIGVSENWVTGLAVRNMQIMRNNYTINNPYTEGYQTNFDSSYYSSFNMPGISFQGSYLTNQDAYKSSIQNLNYLSNKTEYSDLSLNDERNKNLSSKYGVKNIDLASQGIVNINAAARNWNLSYNKYTLKYVDSEYKGGNLLSISQATPDLNQVILGTVGSLQDTTKYTDRNSDGYENLYINGGDAYHSLNPNDELPVAKQNVGNVLEESFGRVVKSQNNSTKGVAKLIKDISNLTSEQLDFVDNFKDIEGENSGGKKGPKMFAVVKNNVIQPSYQRWTMKNPYAPESAKQVVFWIENYATGEKMHFPPYIKNYQHSSNANWEKHNFIGRPDPVFTYNNGGRNGSIDFIVLTDYTQDALIGWDKKTGQNTYAKDLDHKNNPSMFSTSSNKQENSFNVQIEGKIQTIMSKLGVTKQNAEDIVLSDLKTPMIFSDDILLNSQNFISNISKELKFQPAFFSGDKYDFIERIEFLEKTTRPARNGNSDSAFIFTKPPVCRLKLGSWFFTDIVINSVSYGYDSVPWTVDFRDQGRVQPMWANISIQFDMIGQYGGSALGYGAPPLAGDVGGYFSYYNKDGKRTW